MVRQHEHIRNPRERGVIRHDARESNLLIVSVNTKRKRVIDRARDNFAGATLAPVRMITDEVVNQIDIEARAICADRVFTALPGVRLPLPLGEAWGEGWR